MLDADEVLAIVAQGEGSRVEFKRGLPREEKVARTLAAFANTRGGHFLVGIGDRGELLGAPKPRETASELSVIASEVIDPPVPAHVEIVDVEGVPVVVATIGLSADRPHTVLRSGGEREAPIRVGSSTRMARGPALEALSRSGRAEGLAGLSSLERDVLAWVGGRPDRGGDGATDATPQAYARARNIGVVRARRAFIKLERSGRLVGFGKGSQRTYGRP